MAVRSVLVHNFLLVVLLLDVVPLSSALNCIHGKDDKATSITIQGNFCVYYEMYTSDNCEAVQKNFGDGVVVDATVYDQKCGAFIDTLSNKIIACFCTTDNCNSVENIWSLLNNNGISPENLPDVFTWVSLNNRDQSVALLECLKKNLPDSMGSNFVLMAVIGCGIGVGLCCILLPILYRLKESRRKKRLADTWEQRVKQAGEELSSSASGAGTSSSKKKEEKNQT